MHKCEMENELRNYFNKDVKIYIVARRLACLI